MVNWGLDDSFFLSMDRWICLRSIYSYCSVRYVRSMCSNSFLDCCTYSYIYVYFLYRCVELPYCNIDYSDNILLSLYLLSSQIPVSPEACIYSERNLRDRETTLEIFPSAYRRRRVAPLWKLGRNWPEFNPGIQFTVVFVPRGVNPIVARARVWQTFSRSNLRLLGAYFPLCSLSCEMNGKRSGRTSKLSCQSLVHDTGSRTFSLFLSLFVHDKATPFLHSLTFDLLQSQLTSGAGSSTFVGSHFDWQTLRFVLMSLSIDQNLRSKLQIECNNTMQKFIKNLINDYIIIWPVTESTIWLLLHWWVEWKLMYCAI